MRYDSFEELPIWQEAIKLARDIYMVTGRNNWRTEYELKNQLKRAVISVSSNIAEGYERQNKNELLRYLGISKGSLGEMKSQVYLALELKYLNTDEFALLKGKIEGLGKQIGGFMKYLRQQKIKKDA